MILFTFLSLFVYFLFIGERAQTLQGQGGAASGQDGSTLPFLTDHGSHATIRATKFHASTAASVRTEVGFRRGIDDSQTGTEKHFFSYTQFSIQFETRKKQFEIRVCIFQLDVYFKSQNKYHSCSKNFVLKYMLRYTHTESL